MITKLHEFLGYTDLRSIRKWCKKNGVLIVHQGKMEFVFEPNFREAIERPFINDLKAKYGEGWEEMYHLYAEGNILSLHKSHIVPDENTKVYKPTNDIVLKYLSKYETDRKTKAA